MTPDEWLRELEEPPGIFARWPLYLADRRDFDPASWDADQEQAARSTVVEVPAGKVVPAVRPHALAGSVEAMFTLRPARPRWPTCRPGRRAVLAATEDASRPPGSARCDRRRPGRRAAGPALERLDLPSAGHNLMRYRPAEVSQAILAIARGTNRPPDAVLRLSRSVRNRAGEHRNA